MVAHCWVQGFQLDPHGEPASAALAVFHLDRDPSNNAAGNLVALTVAEGRTRGLALTRMVVCRRRAPLPVAEQAVQDPATQLTVHQAARRRGQAQAQSLTWVTGFGPDGRPLAG